MNEKKTIDQLYKLVEAYIKQYTKERAELDSEDRLKNLRSWSSLKNGMRLYIHSSDLMPELKLGESPYFHVEVLGFNAVVSGKELQEVSLKLGRKRDGSYVYGLPNVEALLDYAIGAVDTEDLNMEIQDFFTENSVPGASAENMVDSKSISDTAKLEAKALILDELLGRKSVSFDN